MLASRLPTALLLCASLLGGAAGVILAIAIAGCSSRGSDRMPWKRIVKRPGIVVILALVALGAAGGLLLTLNRQRQRDKRLRHQNTRTDETGQRL